MEDHCVACGEVIPEGIQVCPICNRKYEGISALSRLDNKTLICPECGTEQVLDAALGDSGMSEKEKAEFKEYVIQAMHRQEEEMNHGHKKRS